ncbi:MAG: DUF6088 family protein [Bacteroidota bacterium]
MTGNNVKYVLSVLNSRFGEKLVKFYVTQLQTRQFRMLDMYVNNFPIPDYKPVYGKLKNIVDSILSKKTIGETTIEEENQIDLMVYKLYQLTYDEVLVVDKQPPFSREAYEALGLSTQVPMKLIYYTDATPRKIKLKHGEIIFKRTTSKNLNYKSEIAMLVVQALKEIGKGNQTIEEEKKILSHLKKVDVKHLKHDISIAPQWIAEIMAKALEE